MKYYLASHYNSDRFTNIVNSRLADGWELHGQPIIAVGGQYGTIATFAQALVKFEAPDHKENPYG